ncbi:CAMK/CAMKL/MARK protein kinase [Sphaeroforma arctica JP610]|uniref:CAMK/CAMKL/MARK protein kinase n=1 Tax=Sphaeroforma arctica JP610 TaxID=667725 RepID=A0A0L0FPH9_9EUKA|nr:CAMK/CAMKL/MARK protein kinase [Sphaeroforma arctica JP610]KNC78712.1 CAMK/CAMKL/MARK protein kinase [Sphaeroforma arctica JP610]|eukprot:XP_014152614.1 CAMK/CAMKL/MARK protein kinase [Sphaeroforma arctica JP610]
MMKNVPEIDTIGEDAYKTTSANVQRRSSVTVQRRTSATGISSKVGVQRKISVTGLTNALARLNEVESVTIDNHQDTPPPPKINQAGSEKKGWLSSFFTTPKPDVKLLQKVGEGKFSNVFRAVHTPTLVDVAVKEVLKYKLTQSEWDLVVCEVNVLKRLGEQPHIASLFEVVMLTEEDTLWMVMELVEGDTLDVWMEKQTPKNKISVEMALDITRQVASALDHCHRNNVAHRDIKPANIMVTTDDDGKVDVKLIDFGFATLDSHVHNTVYCGTPRFAAPELWHRKPYLPAPVDMWALGVLFYYLLSGKLPFRSKRIKANVCAVKFEKLENVSEAISSTLTRMFTVNAAERMTASEFLQLSLLLNEDLTASTLGKEKPQLKHPACNPDLHLHVYDLSYFVVRDDILALMVKMGFNELEVIESVEVGLYNHTAAVYYLLRRSRLLETTFDVMHKPKFNSARFKPNVSTPSMEVLRAPKSAATVDEPTPASRKGSTFSNQFMQDLSMATDNADEDYDEIHVNDIKYVHSVYRQFKLGYCESQLGVKLFMWVGLDLNPINAGLERYLMYLVLRLRCTGHNVGVTV